MILFELKRIFKTSSLLFIVIIAFVLSFWNVMNYSSFYQTRFNQDNDIEAYYFLNLLLSSQKDEFDYERTQGERLMDSLLIPIDNPYDDLEEDSRSMSYDYPRDSVYFETLVEALELDGVELDEADQADLDYGLLASNYIDAKRVDQSDYDPKGAITYLIDGDWILYGIIPILLLSFLAIRLEAEGYSRGSETFHRIVPVSRERTLLSRLVSVFILLIVYVLCLVFFTWVIAVFKGQGWGDWFYPYRVVSHGRLSSQAFIVWLEIISLFMIKVMLVVSLSFFIASIIRRVEIASVIILVLVGFSYFMTTHVESLQANWNPLHFSYRLQLTGVRESIAIPGYGNVIEMVIDSISYLTYFSWFILIVIFILLAQYFHQSNRSYLLFRKDGLHRRNPQTLPKFMTSFEMAKLKNFIPNLLTVGSLLLLVGGLVGFISMSDYQSRVEEFGPNNTEIIQERINVSENNLDRIWQSIEEGESSLREMSLMIDVYEEMISYYQQLKDSVLAREQVYQESDSERFYPLLTDTINIHYGLDYHTETAYRYLPKAEYYINGGFFPTTYGHHVSTERNNLFVERNIRPMASSAIQLTPYDAPLSSVDALKEQQEYQLADTSFLGIWYRLVTLYRVDLILLVVLVIFCGVGYGLETGQMQSLSWLHTLPIKRSRIVRQKFVASIIRALQLVGIVIFIVFIAGVLQDGVGQFQLPIIHYDTVVDQPNNLNELSGSYHWVDLGQIVIQSLLLLVLASVFLLSLTLLLTSFIRQTVVVIGCVFVISALGYCLSLHPQFVGISQYLPFTYLNIASILDGSIIFDTLLESVNMFRACGVLVVCSMINYILTTRTVCYMKLSH